MGISEPKRTQKALKIFKMILYGLKMGLNKFKWCLRSSIFFKKNCTSDAYKCKTQYILQSLKRRKKFRK